LGFRRSWGTAARPKGRRRLKCFQYRRWSLLLHSKVPRSLEKRAKLFGFELADLLLIFLYLAMSNLIFGQTSLKPLFVWGGTIMIAGVLYFVKRGKPDGYLQHYGEFLNTPSVFSAHVPDTEYCPYFVNEPLGKESQ
jgi:hypothetical protein